MLSTKEKPVFLSASEDRRRFQRVKIDLLGRYMLADRCEYPCQVIDMSPGGLALLGPAIGQVGERVVAYIDHIGRVEGQIARLIDHGFAMTVSATPRKRDKFAAQLTWLANRDILGLPEDRRHERIVPRNPLTRMVLPNGINIGVRIIDMSLSGAAVATDQRPESGSLIMIGQVQARVIRHLENGIALEFTRLQHIDSLEDNVTGK